MVTGKYDIEEWADSTGRGRRLFNAGFGLRGRELLGWRLVKKVAMETTRGAGEFADVWEEKTSAGHALVRIDTAELADWRAAQERLRDDLSHSMRPGIPRGSGALTRLGDVVFVARDPASDVAASISFTSGNVFVSVKSVGERTVDVSAIAARVEQALATRPRKGARVDARTISVSVDEPGARRVVIEDLPAAAERGWLKVMARDGELRREEGALIYYSTTPGDKQIETFTIRFTARESMHSG